MFPTLEGDDLKLAAAKLTNDTFPHWAKLNHAVRLGSKYGVLPQFISFTAEFMRNIYNQTRYASQMVKGTFGAELGIDVTNANTPSMRTEGIKRLTALAAVVGGAEAFRVAYNSSNGVDENKEQALRETIVPNYDKAKSLLFTLDKETNKSTYVNLSYLSPHAMIAEAMTAALDEKPLDSLGGMVVDNFVGEGSFVGQSLYAAISNVDAYGRDISLEPDTLANFKDRLSYFVTDAFKPGFANEAEKLIEAATKENPRLSFEEIGKRQLGYRLNKIDIDTAATFKIIESSGNAKQAATSYRSIVKRGEATPVQVQEAYTKAARLYQLNMEEVTKHYNNLSVLNFTEEEQIAIMKDAGVSSKNILALTLGKVLPLSPDVTVSAADEFDELAQGKTNKEVVMELKKISQDDPRKALLFRSKLIQRNKDEKSGISERDKLIKNLSIKDKAAYIIANPSSYKDLAKKRIVTKDVVLELKAQGFRP
jgi:hypothetical protein